MFLCYLCVIKEHAGKGNSVSYSNVAFVLKRRERTILINHVCI